MKLAPASRSGELLWRMMPQIYRRWDGTHGVDPMRPVKLPDRRGDLAEYLDSYGLLLDRMRGTLEQRLLDTSPETCQEWLIPYFADLLDVHLVSPDIDGQRMEVARAVLWRQRKGTISNSREVGREVGRFERISLSPPSPRRMAMDGNSARATYQMALLPKIVPGSVHIVADSGDIAEQIIDDDGAGKLVGNVHPTGENDIDYESGVVDVKLLAPPLDGVGNIVVAYAVQHREQHASVVVHEGFRRVATTARIDVPLPSLRTLEFYPGQHQRYVDPAPVSPVFDAIRPGLPAGTVDFRRLSRAREVEHDTIWSRTTAFGVEAVRWQQDAPRGIPCYRDSYQDLSVRTPDMRTPNWARGHYHPHRVIAYSAPREGFFAPGQLELPWRWWEIFDHSTAEYTTREDNDGNQIQERVLEPDSDYMLDSATPTAWVDMADTLAADAIMLIDRRVTSREGRRTDQQIAARPTYETNMILRNETVRTHEFAFDTGMERTVLYAESLSIVLLRGLTPPGHVTGPGGVDLKDETLPTISLPVDASLGGVGAQTIHVIDRVAMTGTLQVGEMFLRVSNSALQLLSAQSVAVSASTGDALAAAVQSADEFYSGESLASLIGSLENVLPSLALTDSLLESIDDTGVGVCRLEYCTVLKQTACHTLEASDCILLEADIATLNKLFLRYSCVPWLPPGVVDPNNGQAHEVTITRVPPLFLNETFGDPACAVLHPVTDDSVRLGAEDGGELGAYHHRRFVLREVAAIDKLRDFLPVTQEPVLVPHRGWVRPMPPLTTREENNESSDL